MDWGNGPKRSEEDMMEIKLNTQVTHFFEAQYSWAKGFSVKFTRAAVGSREGYTSFRVQLGNESGWSDGAYDEERLMEIGVSSEDIEKLLNIHRELGKLTPEEFLKTGFDEVNEVNEVNEENGSH